jgi:hypothetical protein
MRNDLRSRQSAWANGFWIAANFADASLRENRYTNVKDRIAWNNGFRAGKEAAR